MGPIEIIANNKLNPKIPPPVAGPVPFEVNLTTKWSKRPAPKLFVSPQQ